MMPSAESFSGPCACSACDVCGERAVALVWSRVDSIAWRVCGATWCVVEAHRSLSDDSDIAFIDEPRALLLAERVCGVTL